MANDYGDTPNRVMDFWDEVAHQDEQAAIQRDRQIRKRKERAALVAESNAKSAEIRQLTIEVEQLGRGLSDAEQRQALIMERLAKVARIEQLNSEVRQLTQRLADLG
jgi:hypothetical protein